MHDCNGKGWGRVVAILLHSAFVLYILYKSSGYNINSLLHYTKRIILLPWLHIQLSEYRIERICKIFLHIDLPLQCCSATKKVSWIFSKLLIFNDIYRFFCAAICIV